MKNLASLGFAVALAFTGCADSETGGMGPGSDMPDPQPTPTPMMDPNGAYRVNSTFDLATNMPGTSGSILNGLIEATDDPDDPMSWLVDQMLAQMEDGTLKDIIVGVKPFVIGYLNDRLTSLAPDLVSTIDTIGDRLAEVTHKFGVNENLEVTNVDQTYVGRSTADSVTLTIDGVSKEYMFVDYDIDKVVVDSMLITIDRGQERLHIGEHDLPLPWGKLVRLALDAAVIPSIDPTATSLTDLLDNVVDCAGVGQSIQDAIGVGGSAFWGSVCLAGLDMAADTVYDQIAATESTLGMHLVGMSRYKDTNADYRIDELTFGNWTGTMKLGDQDADLAQPAAYVGHRITNPL